MNKIDVISKHSQIGRTHFDFDKGYFIFVYKVYDGRRSDGEIVFVDLFIKETEDVCEYKLNLTLPNEGSTPERNQELIEEQKINFLKDFKGDYQHSQKMRIARSALRGKELVVDIIVTYDKNHNYRNTEKHFNRVIGELIKDKTISLSYEEDKDIMAAYVRDKERFVELIELESGKVTTDSREFIELNIKY